MERARMAVVGMVVMVNEGRRGDIDQLAKSLAEKGLDVERTLPRFRTIVGNGDSALIDTFRAVDGVETVRPQRGVQLPPMGEAVPQ